MVRAFSWEARGHILVVSIAEPPERKADPQRLAAELLDLSASIPEEIRVILVVGKGKRAFSRPIPERTGDASLLSLTEPVARLEVPVIAALSGPVLGPGLELALACDVRIAAATSTFALPHIRRGLIPRDGGTQRLPRLVGKAKALELLLLGERIDAQEAMRIGLVHRVVPPRALAETAMSLARDMASRSPVALRFAKEAVNQGMDMPLHQGLRLEADLYFLLQTTEDRVEGIRSFREKRRPRFKGA